MLNAPAGVVRAIARLRPTPSERSTRATRLHRRSVGAGRTAGARIAAFAQRVHLGSRIAHVAHVAHLAPRPTGRPRPITLRRALTVRLASERMLPIMAALVVLVASFISFQPAAAHAVGNVDGAGSAPRLVIGGGGQLDPAELALIRGNGSLPAVGGTGSQVVGQPSASLADDGTVYKPVAVDTTVQDGKSLLRSYVVQPGDTLTGLANQFGVSMMTIWWANSLTAKDQLHVGQTLVIPPVTGLVVTVKAGDTLASLAAQYGVDPTDILAVNQLEDPTLIVGQTLTLPDAAGAPIATPPPPPPKVTHSSGGTVKASGPSTYGGGRFAWPVVGGNNYISQYFHYGHYAIDIAADYGTPVVAAANGTVIFSGWKNNGGGYQVWISHGSNLYTTYNHMSALTVSTGQSVGRGQQVGRIGQSGWATGPHCHFEVWIGQIWNGGTRVNPLRYL